VAARARRDIALPCDLQFPSPLMALDLMKPALGIPLGDYGLAGVLHIKV
jgi:hypothetical protein